MRFLLLFSTNVDMKEGVEKQKIKIKENIEEGFSLLKDPANDYFPPIEREKRDVILCLSQPLI